MYDVTSSVCMSRKKSQVFKRTVNTHPEVLEADVILILDCDVPWIPTAGTPRKGKWLERTEVESIAD